jgi:hypothetical protein
VHYTDTLNTEVARASLSSLMSDAHAYAALRPTADCRVRSWTQAGAEFIDLLEQAA